MDLDRRSAGVLLHVTSLPGPHGLGDFGPAAFGFVDWLQAAGQRLWQWLPSTPIGPGDSPYQGVSAFAGSQWMVAFEPLVERGWMDKPVVPEGGFDRHRIAFGDVLPWREQQLRAAALGFFTRGTTSEHAAYADWCETQADWLPDYALFMAIRSPRGGQPWWEWPEPLKRRDPEALAQARGEFAAEIAFWQFVQWCFGWQCEALRAHARGRDVAIVGDLPIFVAHDSADVWARPDLYYLDEDFNTTVVAGVPPDELGPDGQRWGNPLYRWDKMAEEDFRWWTARVKRALDSADIVRIDHFRGFAGYYEIPASSPTAKEGRWLDAPGMALFGAIARELGPLPIIAEDLGFITPDVTALREAFDYPGMKILQFAFNGDGNHEFLPHTYPRRTIVYTGTHDNETVRGWWDQASAREQHFAGTYLGCDASNVHWKMLQAACNSVAAMAIYPMQDVLGLDGSHRMNRPGSGEGNWGWRFDWPMVDGGVATRLAAIAATSGRGPFAVPE
jgi:4-alpha-glucanotransferase